jgi:hypothetical protein
MLAILFFESAIATEKKDQYLISVINVSQINKNKN